MKPLSDSFNYKLLNIENKYLKYIYIIINYKKKIFI